ncbi:1-deoxy-d-xylulose 5-phosphate reductoisomerase [gut metagenome]|uniref:1-deoxy-D-xylulose-5-phosphate reductoisomerase n=1 Tax=gut metagenome TaxID=749906 RepID=J9GPM3_9ZZZZ
MTQPVTLLGATGSIGRSTIDVVRRYPDRFHFHAVAGGSRVKELVDVCREVHPRHVAIADETQLGALREALAQVGLSTIEVHAGQQAVTDLAADPETEVVVQAVVGAAGVAPTFAAARSGKRLLLANKESVVCGGGLLMETVRRAGAELLPVDSEHNAIFQCLAGATAQARQQARIILTASGGPFRGRKDLSGITPAEAVRHPKWSMGRKISVDSATLMNKGLEVIEASWLFGFEPERIRVVVHPQSIVHSAVEFADGALIAQLGTADMKTPIAYSLGWPERMDGYAKRLSLAEIGTLTFEEPDTETFPLLGMAYDALRTGGAACIILNAANEVAVEAFLAEKIGFTTIFKVVMTMLEKLSAANPQSVEEILALDRRARLDTRALIATLS